MERTRQQHVRYLVGGKETKRKKDWRKRARPHGLLMVQNSKTRSIDHPLNKSLTLIPPLLLLLLLSSPAVLAAPTPRHCLRSVFSINSAAVASWSNSSSLLVAAVVVACLSVVEERLEGFSYRS
jgi:hypothetical protein